MSADDKAREQKQWKLQESSITRIRALTRGQFLRSAQNNVYAPTKKPNGLQKIVIKSIVI